MTAMRKWQLWKHGGYVNMGALRACSYRDMIAMKKWLLKDYNSYEKIAAIKTWQL